VNLLKSPLRRTTAALAGAFIGLAGAVAFAAPASAHYTELSGKTSCLENGGWTVDWTLTPKKAPIDGKIVKVEETAGGTALANIVEGAKVPTGGTITDSQSFGKDVAEVTLKVKVIWVYGKPSAPPDLAALKLPTKGDESHPDGDKPKVISYTIEQTVKAPEDCNQPPAEQASQILEQDCDSMTIGLHNPENGEKVVLFLKASTGEERVLVVKPGKDETTTFEGVKPGFTVTVHVKGVKGSETVPYTQPKDCNTGGNTGGNAGGSAGGGEENGGGGLPVTGAAAGSIAGGAAALLIAGGTMFVLARRRKVKFTA
jgi:LPXTG-motif cell wall-anchored protein